MLKAKEKRLIAYLTLGYVGFAEILSWWGSQWDSPCLVVSQYQQANNDTGNVACATLHEGIMRFVASLSGFITHDNVTAIATAFIAIFTLTLWRATTRMWLTGEKQIRQMRAISLRQDLRTKESIQLARDAFVSANRPHIIVHAIEFKRFPGSDQYDLAGASLLCFNKGSTSAVEVEVRGEILVSHDPPVVDMQRKIIKNISELVSGQKFRVDLSSERPVRDLTTFLTDRPGLKAANPAMYFVGTISYRDLNGMRRETGYCFLLPTQPPVLGERRKPRPRIRLLKIPPR